MECFGLNVGCWIFGIDLAVMKVWERGERTVDTILK